MPPESEKKIRIKAMCLFVHDGKVLVSDKAYDSVKKSYYYRVIGGKMEFYESGEECVRREVREELHTEIENLELLELVENRFVYNGQRGHELVFLYTGDLANKELYAQEKIHVLDTKEFNAVWVPIRGILEGETPLYPAVDYAQYLKV